MEPKDSAAGKEGGFAQQDTSASVCPEQVHHARCTIPIILEARVASYLDTTLASTPQPGQPNLQIHLRGVCIIKSRAHYTRDHPYYTQQAYARRLGYLLHHA
jgi:hypothetical protein